MTPQEHEKRLRGCLKFCLEYDNPDEPYDPFDHSDVEWALEEINRLRGVIEDMGQKVWIAGLDDNELQERTRNMLKLIQEIADKEEPK